MSCVPAWKRSPQPPRRPAARLPRRAFRGSASCFAARDRNGLRWGANFSPRNLVFAKSITSCDELLRPLAQWSLLEELSLPEGRSKLAETEIAQPALFAIQTGLAALWNSWGVAPDCVIGHSVGEIAALHVAGVLDLPEAIRVVFHRGRIMQRATGNGRMAAVRLSEEEAVDLVAPYGSRLSIGAVNGPRSVVLSGERAALEEVLAALQRRDVSCRLLSVNYAFHSAQMAPLRDALVTQLGDVRTSHPLISFISTVTGTSEIDRPDATYFGRNVREPVRFAAAARAMLQDCGLVVEIGPHPVLSAEIMECATPLQESPSVLASLRRGRPERATMLQACADLYAAGSDINFKKVQAGPGQIVDLPSYPWQRRRHWIPVRKGACLADRAHRSSLARAAHTRWLELKRSFIRRIALPRRAGWRITALGTACWCLPPARWRPSAPPEVLF